MESEIYFKSFYFQRNTYCRELKIFDQAFKRNEIVSVLIQVILEVK